MKKVKVSKIGAIGAIMLLGCGGPRNSDLQLYNTLSANPRGNLYSDNLRGYYPSNGFRYNNLSPPAPGDGRNNPWLVRRAYGTRMERRAWRNNANFPDPTPNPCVNEIVRRQILRETRGANFADPYQAYRAKSRAMQLRQKASESWSRDWARRNHVRRHR